VKAAADRSRVPHGYRGGGAVVIRWSLGGGRVGPRSKSKTRVRLERKDSVNTGGFFLSINNTFTETLFFRLNFFWKVNYTYHITTWTTYQVGADRSKKL
jgi:hypothetical protein